MLKLFAFQLICFLVLLLVASIKAFLRIPFPKFKTLEKLHVLISLAAIFNKNKN